MINWPSTIFYSQPIRSTSEEAPQSSLGGNDTGSECDNIVLPALGRFSSSFFSMFHTQNWYYEDIFFTVISLSKPLHRILSFFLTSGLISWHTTGWWPLSTRPPNLHKLCSQVKFTGCSTSSLHETLPSLWALNVELIVNFYKAGHIIISSIN